MEPLNNDPFEKTSENENEPDKGTQNLQEFIDRIKLENRILGDILEKIKQAEPDHKPDSKNQTKNS